MSLSRLAVVVMLLAAPGASRAADLDPFVPADTESYLAVEVRTLLTAPLVKNHLAGPARELLRNAGEINDVLSDLGFDPLKDLHRLVLAAPRGTDTDRGLIIARGSFDLDRFRKKAEQAARDHADALKVHKVPLGGGASHLVYEVVLSGQDALFVALVDARTLIASPGKDYVVDALKAGRQGKPPVLRNKEFQQTLEKLDPKLTVAVALLGKAFTGKESSLPEPVSRALGHVEVLGGGVLVSNEIQADLVVVTRDEKAARSLRQSVDRSLKLGLVGLSLLGEDRKELGLLLEVVKTIRTGSKGKVVSLSARLTADILQDFLQKEE